MWDEFIDFQRTQVEETSIILNDNRARSHIIKNPYSLVSQASEMLDYLTANNSPSTAKRILMFWNKCCNSAVSMKKIPSNPFKGMKDLVTIPNKKKISLEITDDSNFNDIDPFSQAEARVILKGFENHHKYCHYKSLVHFLFLTGCRTSEAVGLTWSHVSSDLKMITFQDAIVCASGKLIKKRLKNQDFRKFPCNEQLQDLLSTIKSNGNAEGIIFKSLTGKIIRADVFSAFAWNECTIHRKKYIGVVRQLANDGKIHHYKPQYQTRHTFITSMLDAGMEVKDLAKLVGNSPEIIYKYYAASKPEGVIIPPLNLDI